MTSYKAKKGKPFSINDEEFIEATIKDDVVKTEPNYRQRVINPVVILLVILAITYFATMPLYM